MSPLPDPASIGRFGRMPALGSGDRKTTAAKSTDAARIAQLDGLRFLAFLAVFLNHSLVLPMGWIGVDLFFVLSGYLITSILVKGIERPHYFGRFYLRRTFRILPPLYCYLVITLFALRLDLRPLWPWYFSLTGNIREAMHGEFAQPPVCILWSLCVEEHFYLLWPLIVRSASSRSLQKCVLGGLVLVPLLRMSLGPLFDSHVPIFVLLPFRADLLLGGAAIAMLQIKNDGRLDTFGGQAVIAGMTSVVLFCLLAARFSAFHAGANSALFNGLGYSLITAFSCAVVVCALAFPRALPVRILSSEWLAYLGKRSYVMYLCHQIVIDRLHAHTLLVSAMALAVIILVSAVSWRLFEEPCIRLGRSIERALFPDVREAPEERLALPITI